MVQLEAQGARVVSESENCEFLRYKQSTEWVCNAIKRKQSHERAQKDLFSSRPRHRLPGGHRCANQSYNQRPSIQPAAVQARAPSPSRPRYYPYGEQEKRPLSIKGQFTAKLSNRGRELKDRSFDIKDREVRKARNAKCATSRPIGPSTHAHSRGERGRREDRRGQYMSKQGDPTGAQPVESNRRPHLRSKWSHRVLNAGHHHQGVRPVHARG